MKKINNKSGHKVYNTPLLEKIGARQGQHILLIKAPDFVLQQFRNGNISVDLRWTGQNKYDLVWIFINELDLLEEQLPKLKSMLHESGMIWISWFKKSSRQPTELTEDLIRDSALHHELVDIKVAAVDEAWSALKLVIPLKKRKGPE